mmetsp:Transcript_147911/g.368567  ORF Transcript_147911/g.368567 Transcript_147911/m.368567 type:complete len:202 (-) Transcript_147911:761-1366(-)
MYYDCSSFAARLRWKLVHPIGLRARGLLSDDGVCACLPRSALRGRLGVAGPRHSIPRGGLRRRGGQEEEPCSIGGDSLASPHNGHEHGDPHELVLWHEYVLSRVGVLVAVCSVGRARSSAIRLHFGREVLSGPGHHEAQCHSHMAHDALGQSLPLLVCGLPPAPHIPRGRQHEHVACRLHGHRADGALQHVARHGCQRQVL